MKVTDFLDRVPADFAAGRVYGAPFETAGGATVIPVAKIRAGDSRKRQAEDALGRDALGFTGTPVGLFVIHGGEVLWKPAIDENRIALLAVITGLASAVIATLAVLRRPPWPDVRLSRRLPDTVRRR
jgi:hypothetical protein